MTSPSKTHVILAFEASGDQVSAAVWLPDGRTFMQQNMARHGHAAVITELATEALSDASIKAGDITHVAAGRGPGSFTGIRVALAAAKGFQIATAAVPVGVSCLAASVAAFHRNSADRPDVTVATADTRRGTFFAQPFDRDGHPLAGIEDVDPEQIATAKTTVPQEWDGATIIGVGADPLAVACRDLAPLLPVATHRPVDAIQIALYAAESLASGLVSDPLSPLYVAPAFLGPRRD